LSLQELSLSANQLSSLPESFGHLRDLKWLNLSKNKLISLPESFYNLKKLEELWLVDTDLAQSQKDQKKIEHLLPNCNVRWKGIY